MSSPLSFFLPCLVATALAVWAGDDAATAKINSLNARIQRAPDAPATEAALSERYSLLRELIPISQDLAVLGSIGLKALDCLEAGHPAPDGWIVAQRQLLEKIEQPKAEVSIAAVRPVRILLDALSRQDADNKLK